MTSGNQTRWFAAKAESTTGRDAYGRRHRGGGMARLGSALAAVALVGAALVPLALAATVAPASAATFNVQPVIEARRFQGVACPTATTCYAVGENPPAPASVVTITNGTVTEVQFADANTYSLQDIACPTATQCYAVGTDSNFEAALVPITNGVVGATTTPPDTAFLDHIACPSATTCVAAGFDASFIPAVVTIVNGVPGTPQLIDPDASRMGDLDCPTATTCYLVGVALPYNPSTGEFEFRPFILPIVDGVPGTSQPIVPAPGTTIYELPDISCPGASTCFAVGTTFDSGVVVTITDGVPGTIQYVAPPAPFTADEGNGLYSIDCVSVSRCIAGGSNQYYPPSTGYLVTITNGVAGTAEPVAGTGKIYDIACPTATSCVAVGTNSDRSVGVVVTVTDDQTTLSCTTGTNASGAPIDICTVSDPNGIRTVQVKNTATNVQQFGTSFACSNAPRSAQFRVPAGTRYKVVVTDCSSPRNKANFVIRANGVVNQV